MHNRLVSRRARKWSNMSYVIACLSHVSGSVHRSAARLVVCTCLPHSWGESLRLFDHFQHQHVGFSSVSFTEMCCGFLCWHTSHEIRWSPCPSTWRRGLEGPGSASTSPLSPCSSTFSPRSQWVILQDSAHSERTCRKSFFLHPFTSSLLASPPRWICFQELCSSSRR